MTLTVIILLVVLGLVLLLLEFLVFPGLTITGIAGILAIGVATYVAYQDFGTRTGNYVLMGEIFSLLVLMYFVFRSGTWKKMALSETVDSVVTNAVKESAIKAGDTGKTITRLAPVGKVMVGTAIVEGKSVGGLIDENTEIEVIKINSNQIIVKTKTQ